MKPFDIGDHNDSKIQVFNRYIEDEVNNRVLLERFLGLEGFKVYTAETGWEGVDKAIEILPDIFLIDFNLPDIDGREVIEILNRQTETRNIPKIILSGAIIQKKIASPGNPDFFIQKPVDVDKLAEKLEYAIKHVKNSPLFML